MHVYKNVEYTKPLELLVLLFSTLFVFFVLIYFFNWLEINKLLLFFLSILFSALFLLIVKKKYIVKIADFEITSKNVKWNDEILEFNNIKSYKLNRMGGSALNIKLKNGKTVRISANNNFCDSQ